MHNNMRLITKTLSEIRGKNIVENDLVACCDVMTVNHKYLHTVVITTTADTYYLHLNIEDNTCAEIAETPNSIYNIENVREGINFGRNIILTDSILLANTLIKHGITAVSCDHSEWSGQELLTFAGAELVLLPFSGTLQTILQEVALHLKPYAFSITSAPTTWSQIIDINTFFDENGKELFMELVKGNGTTTYADWVEVEVHEKNGKVSRKINKGLLTSTISKYIPHVIIQNTGDEKEDFYFYKNGKYQWVSASIVKATIKKFVPTRILNENLVNSICQLLRCETDRYLTLESVNSNEDYINFQNGLLNLKTFELESHTPNLISTLQLTCDYDPSNTHMPHFTSFINDLCRDTEGNIDSEKIAVIQEFIGLILSNHYVYRGKKALLLYSPIGNTGKTVLLSLLVSMLGPSFIANIPLHSMTENHQFALGSLPGTRAVIDGDLSSNEVKDSALFKQITGGDALCINKKHRQQFTFKYHGGIIIAANCLPVFRDDKGDHLFERLVIIPCENTIPQAKRDSNLLDKLLTEKSAIINWALEGLKRLLHNNFKFSQCSASQKVTEDYRMTVDSVYRFIQTNYVITHKHSDMVSKSAFDEAYLKYCSFNNITPMNKSNIVHRMQSLGLSTAKANLGSKRGIMVYRNIREKTSTDVPFEQCSLDEIPFQ